MWNIVHMTDKERFTRKLYTCPHCKSQFIDEYGSEVKVDCSKWDGEKQHMMIYEYQCPVCGVNVSQSEYVSDKED